MVDVDRPYTDADLYILSEDELVDLSREAYRRLVQIETERVTRYDASRIVAMRHLIDVQHRAGAELKSRQVAA